MSGFGFGGDTYVSEADRVKSDLDNVFADFDAIARPKGAMAPLAHVPQTQAEWPSIEAEPDLSSFDDILTLTQNLDEELSAWEGIVSHDMPTSMPQPASMSSTLAEPIVSEPPKRTAVDPWFQPQLGLNETNYYEPAQVSPAAQAAAPIAAPTPTSSVATPAASVQQSIFNAPVLFSSRQLGQTDLAATQQAVQHNLAAVAEPAIIEIEPIQPIATLPVVVPRPAMPVFPQMPPSMPPASVVVHEEPPVADVPPMARPMANVAPTTMQQPLAAQQVATETIEEPTPPPAMPQLAPQPISLLHRLPAPTMPTQDVVIQQSTLEPKQAAPVSEEPAQPAPVLRRFPSANTGLAAEAGQQPQQVRMQPNGIPPRQQPAPVSPGQQQPPGVGPAKRPVFRRAPTEGSLAVAPDTAQRGSDHAALSQPQPDANGPNRMSPVGRPMLSRSATDASSKPVVPTPSGPKQPAGVPSPNTGLARPPPRPLAGPPPAQDAPSSTNISTESLRSPSSILASQQSQQQQPPANGAPPKQAGGPPKRPMLKKAFSMREPAPQPLQQQPPQGARPVEAPAATTANRASPAVVMTAPMSMQTIQIPAGAFNQSRPLPLSQPPQAQPQQPVPIQQASPMPRPAPPQPQSQPMQTAPEPQHHNFVQQPPLAAMPQQPLQPKQPFTRPQVPPMPQMPQVQSVQVQPMPQMPQPQPVQAQPMPQMPQPQPVHAQPMPQLAHVLAQPLPSMPQPQLAHVTQAAPQQPVQPQPRPMLQHHAHIQQHQPLVQQEGTVPMESPAQAPMSSNQGFKQALQARLEAQLQAQQQGIVSPRAVPEGVASPPPTASSPEPAPTADGLVVPQRPRDRTVSPTPPPTMNTQTRPAVPALPPSGAAPPVPAAASLFPRPAEYSEGPQRFQSVEELILDEKFGLMILIAESIQVTEATKTCAAAIKVFLKYDRVVDMISALIYNEVGQQTSSGTLFRNNSIATHMMTSYTKVIGLPYLKMVIGPEILSLFENIDVKGIDYEIDPEKLGPKAKLDQNISNLKGLVHKLFDRILNSRAVVPKPFLYICNALQSSTRDRFPEARYIVIAGFMFLRYICPALVAPDGYKLVTGAIGENVRRVLVLLSKILQTIANEREFGDKESYMMCMNNLCVEYRSMLQYFFNSLAKPPDPAAPDNVPQVSLSAEDYEGSVRYIYEQIKMNKAKLIAEVQKKDPATNVNAAMVLDALQNLDALPVMHPGPLDARYTQKADQSTPPAHVVNARDNLMSQLNKYREMKEQMEKGRPAGPAGPAPASPVYPVAPQPQQPQFVANYRMPGQPVPQQTMSPPPMAAMPGQVPQQQPMPMMQPMMQHMQSMPMMQPSQPMAPAAVQLAQQPPSGY